MGGGRVVRGTVAATMIVAKVFYGRME